MVERFSRSEKVKEIEGVIDFIVWVVGMVFYRVRRVNGRYYLVKEWYDPTLGKKLSRSLGPCDRIEELLRWCGGWDSNPRRPTPSGPQPDPFDLARAPPHLI